MKSAALFLIPLAASAAEPVLTFERDVRPIVKAHCTHCHGEEEKPEGGVDLRLRRFMDEIVVVGHPEKSKLVEVIRSGEMPEKGKPLTEAQLGVIEKWIAQGAKTAKPEPLALAPGAVILDEDRQYWAFKPVKRPAVPKVANTRNAIDAFVSAKLTERGLSMASEADRRVLIRRVTLDLTGILPTPEEVEAFLSDSSDKSDTSDGAYIRLVDRLLASKAYGERWARHWLDVVGYADSNGYTEADSLRPHAWRYRDYVIRSMNDDKPWDQFIQEQIAGDELAGATHGDYQQAVLDPKRTDQLIATAFLRMAPDGTGDAPDDAKLAKNQVIAEQMKVTTSSLMGMTVACAQCHDHRYDPITQADYYRMRAILDPAFNWEAWRAPAQRLYSLYSPEERAKAAEIDKQAVVIETEARAMSKRFLDEIFEVEILKLPEAERELVYSTLAVKQIAGLLGFADEAYFGRFFRKHTGATPTDFRAAARARLAPEGILSVNLFGQLRGFKTQLQRLRSAFNGRVLSLPECDSGNVVALASTPGGQSLDLANLKLRAADLKAVTGLDLLPTLRRLEKSGACPDGTARL